ncbi:MAG: class I SAM-dependent methyltransferase [Chitinophagaceae bacterium]|nr:class I SAM-dependent methyltransferase [Chitinophagaceae bacterium]
MAVSSYISYWLRRSGLLSIAENIRYRVHQLRFYAQNRAFRKDHPEIILPPDFYIYETYRLSCSEYYYDGLETAKEILSAMGKATDLTKKEMAILDWGCGPGRITRHLPALLSQAKVFGADYNEKYINWCANNLPGITFQLNGVTPPLDHTADFFDAVIGISVFTHLSPAGHHSWINELYRIIKTGGVAFITTQGSAYRLKMLQQELEKFDLGQLVIRENISEGNRLYSSFQPETFIRQLVAGKFDVAEFVSGHIATGEPAQDHWVLKKI